VCLFIVNMLSHDYSAGPRNIIKYDYEFIMNSISLQSNNTSNFRFPGSLSTNAAIFASVMLASRLQTNMGVFGLTAFAVEWFALFPIFRRHLQVDLCDMIIYYIAKLILFINRILLTLAILRYPLSCFQPRSPCSFTFPKQLCSYTYWESVLLRSSVRHG
jgi:phosphatidylinositol glycan class C protein